MAEDFYKTLGVAKNADEKDIKRAYRKLAKQFHPDANPDNPQAEAKFKEINQAYEVLGDSEKRTQYDQFGPDFANFQGFGGQGAGGYQPRGNADYGESPFGDIFDTIFGGMGGATSGRGGNPRGGARSRVNYMQQDGQDIEHDVTISLREAYEGTTRLITKGDRKIRVNIPAGADNGTKVRLSGEGQAGAGGGKAGHLYLIVTVTPDREFERSGDNLTTEIKIDMFTALLGGEIKVPTMARHVKLKVPAGTQSGQKFRLTGKGMPKRDKEDQFGNLYARVLITVPESLNDEQRDLVEQLRETILEE